MLHFNSEALRSGAGARCDAALRTGRTGWAPPPRPACGPGTPAGERLFGKFGGPRRGAGSLFAGRRGSTISQTLSGFQAGVSYTVSFKAAQRGNFNQGGQDFDVYLDSTLLATFRPASASYSTLSTPTFTTTAGSHTREPSVRSWEPPPQLHTPQRTSGS